MPDINRPAEGNPGHGPDLTAYLRPIRTMVRISRSWAWKPPPLRGRARMLSGNSKHDWNLGRGPDAPTFAGARGRLFEMGVRNASRWPKPPLLISGHAPTGCPQPVVFGRFRTSSHSL